MAKGHHHHIQRLHGLRLGRRVIAGMADAVLYLIQHIGHPVIHIVMVLGSDIVPCIADNVALCQNRRKMHQIAVHGHHQSGAHKAA